MTTAAKNNISQCRSKTRLYETLSHECEVMSFEYDMALSMRKNAARARERMMWSVAEVINFAEKLEGEL